MRLAVLFLGVFVTVLLQCVNAEVEATGEHVVKVTPPKTTKTVGEHAEFQCMVTRDDNSQEKVMWTKEDQDGNVLARITTSTVKYEVYTTNSTEQVNSVLRIRAVNSGDIALYYCHYGTNRNVGELIVTYEGLVQIMGNRVIVEGSDMNFTCYVDDSTSYEVTWEKNKVELPSSTLPNIKIEGTSLTIEKASWDTDHGNYTCKSRYNGTDVSAEITLGGPLIIKAPKSIKFTEGERARFECEVPKTSFKEGDPKPTFTWLIGNETVMNDKEEGGRFSIESLKFGKIGSVLHMTDVVFDDEGNYTCIVENAVTTAEHTILLRVRDRLAALWPFIGIMSEVILLIIIIFIHEKCTQGDDIGEEDEEDDVAEPIKEKEKVSLDGEGDMRMRSSKP